MELKEFNEILDSNPVVVVKFSAPWCSPCRAMEPVINNVTEKFAGKVKIIDIDVDESPELATQYKIRSIPTFMYVKNKEIADKSVGAISEETLIGKINGII